MASGRRLINFQPLVVIYYLSNMIQAITIYTIQYYIT